MNQSTVDALIGALVGGFLSAASAILASWLAIGAERRKQREDMRRQNVEKLFMNLIEAGSYVSAMLRLEGDNIPKTGTAEEIYNQFHLTFSTALTIHNLYFPKEFMAEREEAIRWARVMSGVKAGESYLSRDALAKLSNAITVFYFTVLKKYGGGVQLN